MNGTAVHYFDKHPSSFLGRNTTAFALYGCRTLKMAAPVATAAVGAQQQQQQLESEGIKPLLKFVHTSGDEGENAGANVEALRDHLERFLLSEVGNDLQAVKNAGDLLTNMSEENCKLEKQVRIGF